MSDCVLSMTEMRQLLLNAQDHYGNKMAPCKYLFLDKSREYFDDIFKRKLGLIEPSLRKRTGDIRGPVNGRLKGIPFTVCWGSKEEWMTPVLPHGASRLRIFIDRVINPDDFNLYFADFYCVGTKYHHVTLVTAKIDSKSDLFCESLLPKLDWDENRFLRCSDRITLKVVSRERCIVEVLHADSVDVLTLVKSKVASLERVTPPPAMEYSLREGMNKNSLCSICNVQRHPRRLHVTRIDDPMSFVGEVETVEKLVEQSCEETVEEYEETSKDSVVDTSTENQAEQNETAFSLDVLSAENSFHLGDSAYESRCMIL